METSLTNTLSLGAELSTGTRSIAGALDILYLSLTPNIRISILSLRTLASVGALGVLAEGSRAAGLAETLVDVYAARFALTGRLVALGAHAARGAVQQGALGVGGAEHVGTWT